MTKLSPANLIFLTALLCLLLIISSNAEDSHENTTRMAKWRENTTSMAKWRENTTSMAKWRENTTSMAKWRENTTSMAKWRENTTSMAKWRENTTSMAKWRVHFSAKSYTVTEGSDTGDTVACKVSGDLPGKRFTWFSKIEGSSDKTTRICADNECNDTSIEVNQTDAESVLSIKYVQMTHRKIYVCRVFNESSKDNSESDVVCNNQNTCQEAEVLLRVQSRFRPLWPALLVLAEAAVLAIIILWSERNSKSKDYGKERNGFNYSENGHNKSNADKANVTFETLGEEKATTSKVGSNNKDEAAPLISDDQESNNGQTDISSKGSKSILTQVSLETKL